MDKQKIIDKVRKLLALSKGNDSEAEASAAAAKAQAMLAEYNLSLVDLEQVDFDVLMAGFHAKTEHWVRHLMNAAAKLYLCEYFYSEGWIDGVPVDTHALIGAEHNIEVAKLMTQYLIGTVRRLAEEQVRTDKVPEHGRKVFKESFCIGAVNRLQQRIKERMFAGDAQVSNLPAVLSLYATTQQKLAAFLADQFGDGMRNTRLPATYTDPLAYAKCADAAGTIGLDPQVQQRTQRLLTEKS